MVIKEIGGVSRARSHLLYYDKESVLSPKALKSFKQGRACVLDTTSDREHVVYGEQGHMQETLVTFKAEDSSGQQ